MTNPTVLVDVDANGLATLPDTLRSALQITAGGQLLFTQLEDGTVTVRVKHRRLAELGGILTRPDQPTVSVEEMRR